jgi:hypothetical protein
LVGGREEERRKGKGRGRGGEGKAREGKLRNPRQKKERGTQNRTMRCGREKGCYDIMPYASSILYLESFSRRDIEWKQRSWT